MKKIVSISVLVAFLLNFLLCFPVYSQEGDETEKTVTKNGITYSEDVSKRTEFIKEYIGSDGTRMAMVYAEAVHYFDEDADSWEEVDNRLESNEANDRYASKNDKFKVSFAKEQNIGELVRISNDEYDLSWEVSVLSSSKTTDFKNEKIQKIREIEKYSIAIEQQSIKKVSDDLQINEKPQAVGISSQLKYSDIFDDASNTDIKYTVYHNKLEEDVIINKACNLSAIELNFSCSGLEAVLCNDNSVVFKDSDGSVQYKINIPYFEDANGIVLQDIQVEITNTSKGYKIKYYPNEEWINDDCRKYPILFDPAITDDDYNSNVYDTYFSQGSTAYHYSEQKMYFGTKTDDTLNRAYLVFRNLPNIPENTPILSAQLGLSMSTTTNSVGSNIELRTVTVPEAYLTSQEDIYTYLLNNIFGNATVAGSTGLIGSYPANDALTGKKLTYDVTDYIINCYNGTKINLGWVIKYADEMVDDYNSVYTSEATDDTLRPVLTINYGYSLPACFNNANSDLVFAVRNAVSSKYMSCAFSNASGTNIAQGSSRLNNSNEAPYQLFKLELNEETGGYRMRAMCSSNGAGNVVSVASTSAYPTNNKNVQLDTCNNTAKDEWLIIPYYVSYPQETDTTSFFKIVLRSNPSLALTSYGSSEGSTSGTTSTSAGNIFVSNAEEYNFAQVWEFFARGNYENKITEKMQSIANGTYIIRNTYYGGTLKYKYNSLSAPRENCFSIRTNDYPYFNFTITYMGDGYYIIEKTGENIYLTCSNEANSSISITLTPISGEKPSDRQLWKIEFIPLKGYMFVSKYSTENYGERALSCSNVDNSTPIGWDTSVSNFESAYKPKCYWVLADTSMYTPDNTDIVEGIDSLPLVAESGETVVATKDSLNVRGSNANSNKKILWTDPIRDFKYTFKEAVIVEDDSQEIVTDMNSLPSKGVELYIEDNSFTVNTDVNVIIRINVEYKPKNVKDTLSIIAIDEFEYETTVAHYYDETYDRETIDEVMYNAEAFMALYFKTKVNFGGMTPYTYESTNEFIDHVDNRANWTTVTCIMWSKNIINEDGTNRSFSIYDDNVVFINSNTSYNKALSTTVIHELLHCHKAKDHYCERNDSGECKFKERCFIHTVSGKTIFRPNECIMDRMENEFVASVELWSKTDFSEDHASIEYHQMMCEYCKEEIIQHLDSQHKIGG